jgi:hypothetical protein
MADMYSMHEVLYPQKKEEGLEKNQYSSPTTLLFVTPPNPRVLVLLPLSMGEQPSWFHQTLNSHERAVEPLV